MKTEIIEFNKEETYDKIEFIIQDTLGFCKMLDLENGTRIVNIYNYTGEQKDMTEVKEIVDTFKDDIIITSACASTVEFPDSEYTLNDKLEPNKKLVPIDEVVERETKKLEEVGFVDFNFYVDYKNKRAMIYQNDLGNKILEAAKVSAKEIEELKKDLLIRTPHAILF